jgi:magnesium-transporting ATPase (P-type)
MVSSTCVRFVTQICRKFSTHFGCHSSATLTEGFPCFFLSCKANAKVKPAKMGHGPHSSKIFVLFYVFFGVVSFCVLFLCKRVLYYCHWVASQLQLTNMSYFPRSFLTKIMNAPIVLSKVTTCSY